MLQSWQKVLEYAFTVLNRVYYNNELPPIVGIFHLHRCVTMFHLHGIYYISM